MGVTYHRFFLEKVFFRLKSFANEFIDISHGQKEKEEAKVTLRTGAVRF